MVRRDIDVGLLRSFVAVVDSGSVTSAAQLLNKTQAGISMQIKRLEELLDTTLFQREHKRISLAPQGEVLLEHARRIIEMNDEVYGMMTTPSFAGDVRLGLPSDLVSTYAPTILRRFARAWPQVNVQLHSGNSADLVQRLDNGKLDVTLTTEEQLSRRGGETLRFDRLVWVSAQDDVAISELDPLPLAIGGRNCAFRPAILDALRKVNRQWRMVFEVTHQEALTATVEAGLAVNAMLESAVPPNLRILGSSSGLPQLPVFGINIYEPVSSTSELGHELARHIRAEFEMRFGSPAAPVPIKTMRPKRKPVAA
ncbi:MAG: LysR substrate-binding domain-containing protein [Pseudomonadota bacterium]